MGNTTKKTNAERSSQKAFTIAQRIADAACELDFLRKVVDPAVAVEAEKYINILHGCAAELAGARAGELYEQANDLAINQIAGTGRR